MNPRDLVLRPTLNFGISGVAGPAVLFEAFFQFNVSDGPFFAKQLSMTGSSASGDAAVTVAEELCLGTPFDSCLSVPETLILFNIEADAQTSFQSTFTPADFLGVRIDIAIDGGLAGMALPNARHKYLPSRYCAAPGRRRRSRGTVSGIQSGYQRQVGRRSERQRCSLSD